MVNFKAGLDSTHKGTRAPLERCRKLRAGGPTTLALLAILGAGCVPRDGRKLPGWPVVHAQATGGPDLSFEILGCEGEALSLVSTLSADGLMAEREHLVLDRSGKLLSRKTLGPDARASDDSAPESRPRGALDPAPELAALSFPLPLQEGLLDLRPNQAKGLLQIVWRALEPESAPYDHLLATMTLVPDLQFVELYPCDAQAGVAALRWRQKRPANRRGGSRGEASFFQIEGVEVLNLTRARAEEPFFMGLSAHHQRQFDLSATWFRQAVSLDPSFAEAHFNLACALSQSGQEQEALRSLKRAIELDGLRLRALAAEDPDLDPLRRDPAFLKLLITDR